MSRSDTVQRLFLDWDRPVAERVAEYLIPSEDGQAVDLGDRLIIVPTRQAGRRLLQALVQRAPVLSPQIEPPTFLLANPPAVHNIASAIDILGAWCQVLQHIDLGAFKALFPKAPPRQDMAWALPTAKALQGLRATLAESGQRISDVDAGALPETERWSDLKRLEALYISHLRDIEKYDPHAQLIKQSYEPVLPACKEIIVAACPDINPIAQRALDQLAKTLPVTVLIHAPENLADHFGPLGRPLSGPKAPSGAARQPGSWSDDHREGGPASGPWTTFHIDFPKHGESLFLEAGPADQANRVLQVMKEACPELQAGMVALGVPDESIVPALSRRLESEGIAPYNPGGQSLNQPRYAQLLLNLMRLRMEGSFEALGLLLRHPDVLNFLKSGPELLQRLDRFQQNLLPREAREGIDALGLEALRPWLKITVSELPGLMQQVLKNTQLNPEDAADHDSIKVIESLRKAIQHAADCAVKGLSEDLRFRLLEDTLRSQIYYPRRSQHLIDLEGWLELPWNPAPLLILTGMNEGLVPESQVGDAFLPESARKALALRNDDDRYARDAYLLAAMEASRRNAGRLVCVVGKTNADGDVMRPSRLLFHCRDDELVARAEHLFQSPKASDEPAPYAQTIRFAPEAGRSIDPLRVTAFRDYLACPFRFYLKQALGMRKEDFSKREMDPMDFGIGIHHALDHMGKDPELRELEDPIKLAAVLQEIAAGWLQRQFGPNLALHLQIQQDAMNRRLSAAARVHVEELHKGWHIVDTEKKLEGQILGMRVTGTVDRIDRHESSGALRIIDYKSSDNVKKPEEAHIKSKQWVDLQLPLYAHLHDPKASVGYFQIPKATSDTEVQVWKAFGPELLGDAVKKAEDVVRCIQQGIFWPPAEKVQYDDFEALFYSGVEAGLTEEALLGFSGGSSSVSTATAAKES